MMGVMDLNERTFVFLRADHTFKLAARLNAMMDKWHEHFEFEHDPQFLPWGDEGLQMFSFVRCTPAFRDAVLLGTENLWE